MQVKDEKATFGSSLGLSKEDIGEVQQGLQTVQTAVNAIGAVLSASTEVRLNEIEAEKNLTLKFHFRIADFVKSFFHRSLFVIGDNKFDENGDVRFWRVFFKCYLLGSFRIILF